MIEETCCGTYSSVDGCCVVKSKQENNDMIKGFEDYTENLSDADIDTARKVYRVMYYYFDRDLVVTNDMIRSEMEINYHIKLSPSKVRKLINWIHVNNHIPYLIASQNGYGCAKTIEELQDYKKSLEGRVSAINQRIKAVELGVSKMQQAT